MKKTFEINTDNQLNADTYEYINLNWGDQLTKYNNDIITYDNLGNPLSIGENITMSWINGRQLNCYNDFVNEINYKYNVDGIRISKTINNIETKYYLEGTNIILEKTGNNVLYYLYSDDELIGFKYNNDLYYYIKNAQNDIIGIADNNYNVIAKYKYDSWGNILSIIDGNEIDISNNANHIANINPFRYRSYYYDKEINLYYLNSRYYNPIWGRFINADGIINANKDILGYNLYSYCSNNPINLCDENGKWLIKAVAKMLWKGVSAALKTINMKISANMLDKSVKGKVKTAIYAGETDVAKAIKKDPVFTSKINNYVTETKTGTIDKTEVIQFSDNDLQGSLMHATMTVNGNIDNNCGILDVKFHDVYDFNYSNKYYGGGFKGFAFNVGNNLAWSDQSFGVINNYDIYVMFKYDTCEK